MDKIWRDLLELELEQLVVRSALVSGKPEAEVFSSMREALRKIEDKRSEDSGLLLKKKKFTLEDYYSAPDHKDTPDTPNKRSSVRSSPPSTKIFDESTNVMDSDGAPTKRISGVSLVASKEEDQLQRTEALSKLAKNDKVMELLTGISEAAPTRQDFEQFLASANDLDQPIALTAEQLGFKKFIISAGTCDRYRAHSCVNPNFYCKENHFTEIADRLARAHIYAGTSNPQEEAIINLLANQIQGCVANKKTYYFDRVIATPDAVVLNSSGRPTTVIELKGTAPKDGKPVSTHRRQLLLEMKATGAVDGYLVYHTMPNSTDNFNWSMPEILTTFKYSRDDITKYSIDKWIGCAENNIKVFWETVSDLTKFVHSLSS